MSLIKVADKVRQVYKELEKVSADKGVSPRDLVEVSRPEDALLHKQFNWNDTKAAEEWRIFQARQLLRTITIEHEGQVVKQYYNVIIKLNGGKTQKYYRLETVMSSEELKEKVLVQMLRELRSFKEKYRNHKEIYELIDEDKQHKMEVQYGVL